MNRDDRIKGLTLAVSGVLVISPDSLLIRFLTIDFWTVMFLRGLFIGLALVAMVLVFRKRTITAGVMRLDRYAWSMVVLIVFSSFFFVAAIQTTSVAHALIIVGSAPIFSALFARILLGETVSINTSITILIVFLGLILVVNDQSESHLGGDLLALLASLCWALNFVLARRSATRDMSLVMLVSGLIMALGALPMAIFDGLSLYQAGLGATLGILNGVALFMLITAPRYIPAAEVAVFLPVETVLGSFLVWWVLGENPGAVSIVAGVIIVIALVGNSLYQLRQAPAQGIGMHGE
jgi:drug/metabolite transporter (DMT)-like permease